MAVTAVAPAEVGVAVGDFFVRSWGYDQTNIDFYKVVGLTPKGVKVQHWSTAMVDDNGPITHVVPGPCAKRGGWVKDTEFGGRKYDREVEAPVETKRLSSYGPGSVYIAVGMYADHARKWDGTPMYETGVGYGH